MDANGILQVSAKDKSTGKQECIRITNDKGRLSKEEIDRMLAEAEKFKQEDDNSALAEKEEYEHRLKELQQACMPIMSKMHQPQGPKHGSTPHHAGPTVEEVD
ncbi:hypothetical protein MRX96_042467 [Rhipicephalus microplus]